MDSKSAKSLFVFALLLAVSACNTVQGLGEDISSVGRKGEEVID